MYAEAACISVCRKIGESLMDDICKPLRNMCDNHNKVKKPVSTLQTSQTVTGRFVYFTYLITFLYHGARGF